MFYEIFGDVYRWVRESGGLTQNELGSALNGERKMIGRWEKGLVMPRREHERVLFQKARCTRERFGELVCKALSGYLGKSVTISAADSLRYRPTTPLAGAEELLAENHDKIPRRLRICLQRRIQRARTLSYAIAQETLEIREEIEAFLDAVGEPAARSSN